MDDGKGVNILDVKVALEEVFKGCKVEMSHVVGSQHAKVSFDEYEVRVILSGSRAVDRSKHLRFMRRIKQKPPRKPIKQTIMDIATKDEAEFVQALKDVRAYLLGIVQAIQHALKPPHQRDIDGIEALFNSGDSE